MSKQQIKINSIFNGIAASQYFAAADQYNSALGIEPDHPVGSQIKTGGVITPTAYSDFSGANVDGFPLWFLNSNKDTNTYVYLSSGGFIRYSSSFGSETDLGTPTSGAGNGAAYYNNYFYLATPTNVSRYGPLNNSPSLTNTVWTGATLGSQTALTNTTYPSLRGVPIPNHPMHTHTDNSLYFGDYVNGQGLIHRIHTRRVTDEGDTDDNTIPSAYNVLDLPFGYHPTSLCSFDTDLAILAIQTTDTTINQGNAALFFWNTVDESFYRQVPVPDPIATCVKNINGSLVVFSGNASAGMRASAYVGGETLQPILFMEEGTPPFQGAVDSVSDKIYFGNWTTYPEVSASVFSFGSKRPDLPRALHCPARTTSDGATPTVTAVKVIQQANNSTPRMIIGWGDSGDYGIDQLSTSATINSPWRSEVIQVNQPFTIEKIRIPLGAAVAVNMEIIPTIYFDENWSSGTNLTTINNTNYPNNERNIVYKNPTLSNLNLKGAHNFILELNFGGTVNLPVLLPIEITIDILNNDQ